MNKVGMDVLIIVLGTFGMAIHHNVKSISMSSDGEHYVVEESDGKRSNLRKDKYMLTIMR